MQESAFWGQIHTSRCGWKGVGPGASLFITVLEAGHVDFKRFSGQEMKPFGRAPGTSNLH